MARLTLSSIRPHRYVFAVCLSTIMACFAFSPRTLAYHHFYLKNGSTYMVAKWQTLPVQLIVDNGPTDIFPEIQTAVTTWKNVTTAKDVLAAPTRATVDFTGSNFDTAWGRLTGDGQQEVVFDADGSAFSTATGFAPGSANGVTRNMIQIVGGQAVITDTFIILNGTKTSYDRLSTEVHELGHAQGLGHSSVGMHNSNNFPSDALNPISSNALPTMHPFSDGLSQNRRTLEPDDIASLSELYPEPSFATALGSIEGTVKRCSTGNAAVTGANVRAVNVSNPNIQLSRFTGFDGNNTGRFVINGLPPGNYRLIVEPMGANGFTIGSTRDDKFRPPPVTTEIDFPTEYYNPPDEESCTEELPDTAVDIAVTAGGHATDKNFKVGSVDLAFVVDDTGSMSPEIAGVRQVLTAFVNILDNLHRLIGTRFPNTTIITFKDNVTKRLISNDPVRLRAVIDSLTASGGGDCPESSNAALLAAGRQLRNGGVAMLITDADSRSDGPARNAVTQLYRSKSLTLSTLLSGSCGSTSITEPKSSSEINDAQLPESTNFDEYPPEPTLGFESSVRTFSEESIETGGVFTFVPGIKSGDATETQRYINTGTNIAVSSAVPAIALVSPGDGQRGTTLNIEIDGANTNFQSTSVLTISGDGITVNSRTVNAPDKITANITIAPGATLGFRDVTVTTNLGGGATETATGFGAFNVIAPLPGPTITSVTPSHGAQGATLNVTITASNTHFVNGTSVANFGAGIVVNSTTVLSSTNAVANISINPAAATSPRHISVTTGSETATDSGVGLFMVIAPPPAIPRITALNPVQGTQGQTLTVTITGENTHFVNGTSVVSFSGSGITVNSTNVSSSTAATANITIAPDAALGFRDVFVNTGAESAAILSAFQVLQGASVQLSASSYSVNESELTLNITVTRSGITTSPASVKYATSDQTDANFRCDPYTPGQATIYASRKCDYHIAVGTLRFAAGETSKQFTLSFTDDIYVEAQESLTITLSNAVGTVLGQNSTATVTINDNDTFGLANPIDNTRFFVRQLYVDLLSREPDPAGWNGWIDRINLCGQTGQPPPPCDRVTVAGDGFLRSGEFFDRQFFVIRLYRTGLGRIPRYDDIGDLAYVSGFLTAEQLELNKQSLVDEIIARPEFSNRYNGLSNTLFVDTLLQTADITVPADVRLDWINSLGGTKTRARVYREISERAEVSNKYLHEAQVVSAYYGFFTRNPDGAYLNYLQRLNSGEITLGDLGNAFVNALEYRQRFGQ